MCAQDEAFDLYLIVGDALMIVNDVLMEIPTTCMKCGRPVVAIEPFFGSKFCVSCARLEAARKMSFSIE